MIIVEFNGSRPNAFSQSEIEANEPVHSPESVYRALLLTSEKNQTHRQIMLMVAYALSPTARTRLPSKSIVLVFF